jgi:hypothetical protein
MGTILRIILILLLVGAFPTRPHRSGWMGILRQRWFCSACLDCDYSCARLEELDRLQPKTF